MLLDFKDCSRVSLDFVSWIGMAFVYCAGKVKADVSLESKFSLWWYLFPLYLQGLMWMQQSFTRQPFIMQPRWRTWTSSRCWLSLEATSMHGTTEGKSPPTTRGVAVPLPSALSTTKVRPSSLCCLNDAMHCRIAQETLMQEALFWKYIRAFRSKYIIPG